MPEQFDIYRNPSAKTNRLWLFYLIIQNDYFNDLSTKIVVPLVLKDSINLSQERVTPQLTVNYHDYYLFTPAVTFLETKK